MQLEMPLFQTFEGKALVRLPDSLVACCNYQHDAVRLCIRNSRIKRSVDEWAELLGVAKGTFSLLLNGGGKHRKRYFPPELIEQIQLESGNCAVSQWWQLLAVGMLNRQRMEQLNVEAM